MFKPSKNLKPIIVDKDVHVSNPKKKKTFNINMNHKFQDV